MAKTGAKCQYCDKVFLAEVKEINRGNGKFCSLACAACFGNRLRKRVKRPSHVCCHCGKAFYRKPSLIKTEKVYCSKKCFYEATHPLYTKAKLIEIIKKFYEEEGRIPFHEEFNSNREYPSPDTYKAAFGSWNKAIEAAGFASNSSSLGRVCIAKDGHKCRSFAEKIIDDWLFQKGIEHEKEVYYPNSGLRADWCIACTYIEYIGISLSYGNDLNNCYRLTLNKKRDMCLRSGIKLVELYPKDLLDLHNKLSKLKASAY